MVQHSHETFYNCVRQVAQAGEQRRFSQLNSPKEKEQKESFGPPLYKTLGKVPISLFVLLWCYINITKGDGMPPNIQ